MDYRYKTGRGLTNPNRRTAPRPRQIASNNDIDDGSGTVLGGLGLNSSVKSLASAKDGSLVT
jgi:hypothetical protein